MKLNPSARVRRIAVGHEALPLLVIDDFVTDPDALVRHAAARLFTERWQWFPGVRTRAPLAWRRLVVDELSDLLRECFALDRRPLAFPMCHYSLITTPAGRLAMAQRIPHFDSVRSSGIASIHYLFRAPHGGTAFYRHRTTGFESIDANRHAPYLATLEQELTGIHAPSAAYIDGDTALFEQTHVEAGRFNRVLFYRQNALHSGSIGRDFVPDANPLTGRLSINSFINVGP